jgi:6-pyruvoyl-tetrahydropterin synthase
MAEKILSTKIIGSEILQKVYRDFTYNFETVRREIKETLSIKEMNALFFNKEFQEQIVSRKNFLMYFKKKLSKSLFEIKKTNTNFKSDLIELKSIGNIKGNEIIKKLFNNK